MAPREESGPAQEDVGGIGEIEKGVPIPTQRGRKPGAVAARLMQCAVGDSFVIRGADKLETVRSFAHRRGICIVTRMDDGCANAWRIWRKA